IHPQTEKVRRAVELVRERRPDLIIDGEMQADTAVVPEILEQEYPFSVLQGGANVLVFPDLASANIAYKLLQRLGGAQAIGPILMGTGKSVHVLQRGDDVDDIVNIACVAVMDAQELERAAQHPEMQEMAGRSEKLRRTDGNRPGPPPAAPDSPWRRVAMSQGTEPQIAPAVLRAWPKADLPLHLDGSVRPETYLELARELPGQEALTLEEVRAAITVGDGAGSLTQFLSRFPVINRVTQTAPALRRITREALEDAVQAGVRYVELRAAPWLHTQGGLAPEAVVEAILAGMKEAARQIPILSRLILVALRGRPEEENRQVVQLALRYREHGVAGIDLAGDESLHPTAAYGGIFRE